MQWPSHNRQHHRDAGPCLWDDHGRLANPKPMQKLLQVVCCSAGLILLQVKQQASLSTPKSQSSLMSTLAANGRFQSSRLMSTSIDAFGHIHWAQCINSAASCRNFKHTTQLQPAWHLKGYTATSLVWRGQLLASRPAGTCPASARWSVTCPACVTEKPQGQKQHSRSMDVAEGRLPQTSHNRSSYKAQNMLNVHPDLQLMPALQKC